MVTLAHSGNRGPFLLLLSLLLAHFVVVLSHYEHPLVTDEHYYVAKGRHIAEHGRFAPAEPHAVAVEEGRAYGTSDWRPPGYPLFLAAISLGDFDHPAKGLRLRATVVQFLGVAATLIALFAITLRSGVRGAWRYLAAVLIATPPWTFAFVNDLGPDALTVPIVGASLLLVWVYVTAREPRAWPLLAATLVAGSALFFRPEMIVTAPFLVAVAFALQWLRRRVRIVHFAAASLLWCALVGAQAAYHTWHTGIPGIFGGLHIVNAGAFEWVKTWPGTEKEAYDFVYAITEARPASLPDRAFDDERERAEVLAIVARIQARGRYLQEDDAFFARLAAERRRAHPVRTQLLRGWHAVNMWFNIENNSPLLTALAAVPREARRPFYGALVLLRLVIFMLAGAAVVRCVRAFARGRASAYDLLFVLLLLYAVFRTLFVGAVLNWNVHRYLLSAWPPVLWCASAALRCAAGGEDRSGDERAQRR